MKLFKRAVELWFLGICLLHLACGGGNIHIDRNAGQESAVNGITATADNALVYFSTEIFPLLIQSRSGFAGGCAGASGCHLNTSPYLATQTFFKIDPNSSSNTWNWAQVRRNRVITTTGYADGGSLTLKARKDSSPIHNSFSTWSIGETATIELWTSLTQ